MSERQPMKYPKLLTVKTTKELNRAAADLAKAAGRNRSEYIRDLINTLAKDKSLQNEVNQAIGNKD
jgi:hypothetical protein